VHFIQETGYSFELGQIERECDTDELTLHVEDAYRKAAKLIPNRDSMGITWKGRKFLVWFCVTGDTVTLRSISAAFP